MAGLYPTLCVGELLSERVGCDDQHPLDPPEKHHIVALQLEDKHTVFTEQPRRTI